MLALADEQDAMTWFLVGGAILCGWAILRTLGGERERHVLEQRVASCPPAPSAPSEPPAPARKMWRSPPPRPPASPARQAA